MTEISNLYVPGDQAFLRQSDRGVHHEASFAGALSFMRRRYTRDLTGVDVAIMGVPFDLAVSDRSGTRMGPRAIRGASAHMAWQRPWPWVIDPYEALSIVDYGDCSFDSGRPEGVPDEITAAAAEVVQTGTALMSFGGDHFVTYPLLKAHVARHGPLSLIHFDAHTDTWADEPGRIDHGTMLWHAAREGLVDPSHSVQVGIRTHNDDTLGFNIIDAVEVHRTGPAAVAEKIRQIVGARKAYLTFDIDVLDPSAAPGTGTPVIGGLSTFQAQEILRSISGVNLVGMDLVEVAPAYDQSEITALAAAAITNDILCLYAAAHAARDGA
ncbi:agmatinase [Pseudodonghicola flavimaris]|uniref:Agmatinase n=1 Tax=Pseudodonghicola flavimaris TaxID=3050036 RepID=A0ABT7F1U5_9RHOB|nr:agmatinase [Pseudodonghicola flavimaris]MDK3018571.1 agmatinase [Pseudodonghicola flavimaris]